MHQISSHQSGGSGRLGRRTLARQLLLVPAEVLVIVMDCAICTIDASNIPVLVANTEVGIVNLADPPIVDLNCQVTKLNAPRGRVCWAT